MIQLPNNSEFLYYNSDEEYAFLQKNVSKVNSCSTGTTWLQTYTKKKVNIFNLGYDDIDILDIAHSLSQTCRFNGHSETFYSNAQHSIHVSNLVYQITNDNVAALYGLLHDGSECYISDISSPIKRMPEFSKYREVEHEIQTTIYNKFGLYGPEPAAIKEADIRMLATEGYFLMGNVDTWNLPHEPDMDFDLCLGLSIFEAKGLFLEQFCNLYNAVQHGK